MGKLKPIFSIGVFTLVFTSNFLLVPDRISAQQDELNYQEFYDVLSPYGQWIEDSNYGYIWIPTAGTYFTPYLTNGYWLYTDCGWMWESDYEWGWAAFHYGRWDYNGYYGWFWVPENEWGPSWVTWRCAKGYYGWAPMRPGVSINITFSSYNDVPTDRWVFVIDRNIEKHDIGKNRIEREQNSNILNISAVVNKTFYDNKRRATYVAGPDRQDVQEITGVTIKSLTVLEKDRPGKNLKNDQIQIYRPMVKKNNNRYKPAPLEVTKYEDVKPISERNTEKHNKNFEPMQSKNKSYPKRYLDLQKIIKIKIPNNNSGMHMKERFVN